MPRPQFSLKTMLWLMAVVGALLAGAAWQRSAYRADRHRWQSEVSAAEEAFKKMADTAHGRSNYSKTTSSQRDEYD